MIKTGRGDFYGLVMQNFAGGLSNINSHMIEFDVSDLVTDYIWRDARLPILSLCNNIQAQVYKKMQEVID